MGEHVHVCVSEQLCVCFCITGNCSHVVQPCLCDYTLIGVTGTDCAFVFVATSSATSLSQSDSLLLSVLLSPFVLLHIRCTSYMFPERNNKTSSHLCLDCSTLFFPFLCLITSAFKALLNYTSAIGSPPQFNVSIKALTSLIVWLIYKSLFILHNCGQGETCCHWQNHKIYSHKLQSTD